MQNFKLVVCQINMVEFIAPYQKMKLEKLTDSLGRAEESLKQAINRQSEGVEMKDMKSLSGGKKIKKTRRRNFKNSNFFIINMLKDIFEEVYYIE